MHKDDPGTTHKRKLLPTKETFVKTPTKPPLGTESYKRSDNHLFLNKALLMSSKDK